MFGGNMLYFIEKLNELVWGLPALVMILGVGIYLTVATGFAQFKFFPKALRAFIRPFLKKDSREGRSQYQALCTALAATVGTGNLAGVAGAIALGGPGAVFWMWVCGILGMVTKFAEATLAVRYRRVNKAGERVGGPMYMIQSSMEGRWHWLAGIYCFFGVVASFGVGNATQINTVIGGINSTLVTFGAQESWVLNLLIGTLIALLLLLMLTGGGKRIGSAAEKLVPFASVVYILLCVGVLMMRASEIPNAIRQIVVGALTPDAVTGGVIGSLFIALRVGAARGVFTNEAGMGTASIAHASADVAHPADQGLMGIMEVFIDTLVICTMTALVILCSGIRIPYGIDAGIQLTTQAFVSVYGDWVSLLITGSLCLFALATVLGWGLYGIRCAQYLFGDGVWKSFVYLQSGMVIIGAMLNTGTLWLMAETVNGLMAIPNLIVLAHLVPELRLLVRGYQKAAPA